MERTMGLNGTDHIVSSDAFVIGSARPGRAYLRVPVRSELSTQDLVTHALTDLQVFANCRVGVIFHSVPLRPVLSIEERYRPGIVSSGVTARDPAASTRSELGRGGLPTFTVPSDQEGTIRFTFRWEGTGWEGRDYAVDVA